MYFNGHCFRKNIIYTIPFKMHNKKSEPYKLLTYQDSHKLKLLRNKSLAFVPSVNLQQSYMFPVKANFADFSHNPVLW